MSNTPLFSDREDQDPKSSDEDRAVDAKNSGASNEEDSLPSLDLSGPAPSDEITNREATGVPSDESGRTQTYATSTSDTNPQSSKNTDAPTEEADPEDAIRNPTDPETTPVERPTPGLPINVPHASELDEKFGTRFSNVAPDDPNVSRISSVAGIAVGQNNKDLVDPTADNRRGDDLGAHPPLHTYEDGTVAPAGWEKPETLEETALLSE